LPATSNPHTDLTPLPSGQILTEVGMHLNVAVDRETTIPIGIYEIVGATTGNLLASFELPIDAAQGTGERWCVLALEYDAAAWAGKRLGVARSVPRDGDGIDFRYSGDNPAGWHENGIGTTADLPSTFSAGSANAGSVYAYFEDAPAAGSADLVSSNSSFDAVGEVSRISDGVFVSQNSSLQSQAARIIVATAILLSQNSSVESIAERIILAGGSFVSQNSSISGSAERIIVASGNFLSQDSTLSGSASSDGDEAIASGNLISGNSSLLADANRIVVGLAEIESGAAVFSGTGNVQITYHVLSGILLSGNSYLSGSLILEQINNIPAFPSSWIKMDYQELFDDVAELLYELGDNRLFYKKNSSTFNPRTGEAQAVTPVNSRVQGQGVMYNFKAEEYDGENVKFGDMMMIFQPYKNSNYDPEIGMFCDTAGATWRLLNFEKILPASKLIAYVMHLRK
jgi:hypothetical protein